MESDEMYFDLDPISPDEMYVDPQKDKPYHCPKCGDTYEPCPHWFPELEEE